MKECHRGGWGRLCTQTLTVQHTWSPRNLYFVDPLKTQVQTVVFNLFSVLIWWFDYIYRMHDDKKNWTFADGYTRIVLHSGGDPPAGGDINKNVPRMTEDPLGWSLYTYFNLQELTCVCLIEKLPSYWQKKLRCKNNKFIICVKVAQCGKNVTKS